MELWEFVCCIEAHKKQQQGRAKEQLAISWQTANLTGAAFAGKLKRLSAYLKRDKTTKAPKVSREKFEARLRLAEEGSDSVGVEETTG